MCGNNNACVCYQRFASDPKTGMTVAKAKTLINKINIPEYHPHWKAIGFLEGRASMEPVVRELIQLLIKLKGSYFGEGKTPTRGLICIGEKTYDHMMELISCAQKELEG